MDLLGANPAFRLDAPGEGRIYTSDAMFPPQYIAPQAVVKDALITAGCSVYGTVRHSVLSEGVTVEEGAEVDGCILMTNVHIGKGARLRYAVVDEGVVVGDGAVLGDGSGGKNNLVLVGRGYRVPPNAKIASGAIVESLQ
jgi:glucose-1-phosphate adenylyltransferase